MTILAWHNDPALKADAVERMKKHRDADEFLQGEYVWAGTEDKTRFVGCFHGCLTAEKVAEEMGIPVGALSDISKQPSWHQEGERIWGIPHRLGLLLDGLFESHTSDQEAGAWAVAVTEAIPVGADLSAVKAEYEALYDADSDWLFDGHAELLRLLAAAPVVTPDA